MCLAIAPDRQCSNNLFARTWRQVSSTPLRLFSFGAGFHLVLSALLAAYSVIMDVHLNVNALINAFSYGIIALVVYGFLMTWLPKKYALSPVHYGRYNSVYLLMFVALLVLEAGALISNEMVTTGLILLLPGWAIAVQGMKNMFDWMPSRSQSMSRVIVFLLLAIFVSLLAAIVAQVSDNYHYMVVVLTAINLIIWPMILLAFKVLLSKAPLNTRVVSV